MQMEKNQITKTFRNIEYFKSLEVTGTQGHKREGSESKKESRKNDTSNFVSSLLIAKAEFQ